MTELHPTKRKTEKRARWGPRELMKVVSTVLLKMI
jgi:hypothetical protein